MIQESLAETYVQAFALMKGFPQAEEKLELLVGHFSRAAQDEHHAQQMVDWVHQNKGFSPEMKDIWDAAKATARGSAGENHHDQYRTNCQHCHSGWVLGTRGGVSFARRCPQCKVSA